MSNQILFDLMLSNITGCNRSEKYKELLEFYSSLPLIEREKIDVSKVHEKLLDDIANYDGDLEIIYGFGNYDDEFKKKADERVKACKHTALICQYLDVNDVSNEELVGLSVRAIESVMPDDDSEIEALSLLKEKCVQRGLYDDVVCAIKTSGVIETVVCAALCFDSSLIDGVFGGKAQMYMYLKAGKFTDEECLEMYVDRLLTMDSCELQNDLEQRVKNLDNKILNKTL